MNDVDKRDEDGQDAAPAPHGRPGDERAYEDSWYQVLRRRAEEDETPKGTSK